MNTAGGQQRTAGGQQKKLLSALQTPASIGVSADWRTGDSILSNHTREKVPVTHPRAVKGDLTHPSAGDEETAFSIRDFGICCPPVRQPHQTPINTGVWMADSKFICCPLLSHVCSLLSACVSHLSANQQNSGATGPNRPRSSLQHNPSSPVRI